MITVKTIINAPILKVWEYWTKPEHIKNWNFASDDWHCPKAVNNLKIGGKFIYTMASKDGEMSFDFSGNYINLKEFSLIEYALIDGRKVIILFEVQDNNVVITESFDPENENLEELQKNGWQNILNNFKKYTEQ